MDHRIFLTQNKNKNNKTLLLSERKLPEEFLCDNYRAFHNMLPPPHNCISQCSPEKQKQKQRKREMMDWAGVWMDR